MVGSRAIAITISVSLLVLDEACEPFAGCDQRKRRIGARHCLNAGRRLTKLTNARFVLLSSLAFSMGLPASVVRLRHVVVTLRWLAGVLRGGRCFWIRQVSAFRPN